MITTINQTALSYAAAIVGAEYILRLVTPGTHDWNKFVTVEELIDLISQCKLITLHIHTSQMRKMRKVQGNLSKIAAALAGDRESAKRKMMPL